tara:strand:- start:379 stop:699 length:321 start_codon:yes stop_codon:yes gene_type:complete
MNFDEFWNAVKDFKHDLLLKTLDRELEFEVSQRSKKPIIPKNDVLYITPMFTRKERSISISQFYHVWNEAKTEHRPFISGKYTQLTRNSSYIVSIMKFIVGDQKID